MAKESVTGSDAATAVKADAQDSSANELDKLQQENEGLKQRLSTVQGRDRAAAASVEHQEEMEKRVMRAQEGALQIVLDSDLDPSVKQERLKTHYMKMGAEGTVAAQITRAQPELEKLVNDAELDWSAAPELADSRALWQARRPDEALRAARNAIREKQGVFTKAEVEQIVEDRANNVAQSEGRVDMGRSTAGGDGDRTAPDPKNTGELTEYLSAARAKGEVIGKDRMNELMQNMKG
jgi:hypothetical protein